MPTKSTFAFKALTSTQSIGLLQNQVAVSSALLCVSLSMNKGLLAENKNLKLHLASNGSSHTKKVEMKTLNDKINKITTRCKAFQSSAVQLAAQLDKSSQLNKILREKVEAVKLELEKERIFRTKLSKQCRRLDQHVVDLTRKNKEEKIKFIPDFFGETDDYKNSIEDSFASQLRKLAVLTTNGNNDWKKYQIEIENLKKQKLQADEKREAAEEKLSQFQNGIFLLTMH